MSGSPKKKPNMPPGYKVIRGNVVDIVDRVEREVNHRTRLVERSRQWREMTLRESGGQRHTFVGEVLDRARHGDELAIQDNDVGHGPSNSCGKTMRPQTRVRSPALSLPYLTMPTQHGVLRKAAGWAISAQERMKGWLYACSRCRGPATL